MHVERIGCGVNWRCWFLFWLPVPCSEAPFAPGQLPILHGLGIDGPARELVGFQQQIDALQAVLLPGLVAVLDPFLRQSLLGGPASAAIWFRRYAIANVTMSVAHAALACRLPATTQ